LDFNALVPRGSTDLGYTGPCVRGWDEGIYFEIRLHFTTLEMKLS